MRLASKLLLFLVLLFFFEKPFGFFISVANQKRQVDDRLEKIDSLIAKTDLFIVGSSRAVNGIVPSIIQNETGLSTYGMAYSGSNLDFHKSIVSLLLSGSDKPKYLLLNIDPVEAFIDYQQMIYRKDKLLPYLSNKEVLKEFCQNSEKNYWLSRMSWSYRENQNIYNALSFLKNGKEQADITNNVNEFGYIPIRNQSPDFDGKDSTQVVNFDDLEINEAKVNSFKWILKLCKERNVKVFISILPSFKQKVNGLDTFVQSKFINTEVLIDLSASSLSMNNFYDRGHLNYSGAQIVTNKIADRIKNGI